MPTLDKDYGKTFSFTIKLVNSDFMLFTDLSQLTKFKPYYWTNKASSPLLQPTIEVPESLNPHSFAGIGIDSDCLMAYKGPWPLAYTYRFPAQKMPWRYYIVSNDEKAHFEIDHEPLDDTRLLIFNSIDLSSNPQDTTVRSIAERFPDSICILFETTEPVPLRQEGYSDIRLKKDDKIRIPHLPNPAIVDQGVRVVHMP